MLDLAVRWSVVIEYEHLCSPRGALRRSTFRHLKRARHEFWLAQRHFNVYVGQVEPNFVLGHHVDIMFHPGICGCVSEHASQFQECRAKKFFDGRRYRYSRRRCCVLVRRLGAGLGSHHRREMEMVARQHLFSFAQISTLER